MPRELRLPGEGDREFLARAKRAARYARVLVDAALANRDIQWLIASPAFPLYTEEGERRCPTVRIEYEQAMAIGGIGECLAATKNKSWGNGPFVCPLEPNDPVMPVRITYVFKEGSLYNRRFLQRRKLKELLGRKYRPLVQNAKRSTRRTFLEDLTNEQAYAIRTILQLEPSLFWAACKGTTLLELPDVAGQVDQSVLSALPTRLRQQSLSFDRPSTREDAVEDRDP